MVILLKGRILPIGGVASGRVCACSLRSRLVFEQPWLIFLFRQLKESIVNFPLMCPLGRFSYRIAMSVCLSVRDNSKQPLPEVVETSGQREYR